MSHDDLLMRVEAATPVLREKSRRPCAWVAGADGCGMNGAARHADAE